MATNNNVNNTSPSLTVATGNCVVSAGNLYTSAGSITSATTLTASNGNITASSGNLVISSGNIVMSSGSTSTASQIVINSVPFFHSFGDANSIMIGGAGNLTLNPANANLNTGVGTGALTSLVGSSGGGQNCALGMDALKNIKEDTICVGIGAFAGQSFQGTSSYNTFFGHSSGSTGSVNCTGSYNTFYGGSTGGNYSGSESNNTLIGYGVGGTAGESNVIRIGNATGTAAGNINAAHIFGIYNNSISGTLVKIGSDGKMGTISSTRASKYDITDIGTTSSLIYNLNPCSFYYINDTDPKPKQYGFIAEEVEPICPEIVQYDADGNANGLALDLLDPLILNELIKLKQRVTALQGVI